MSGRPTAASDGGALDQHQWPRRDPLCEPREDLQGVPVKIKMSQPQGIPTHSPSLGARGCSRTSPGADGRRKRADAPSFRHRRTSLRHAQMPRRLSPLSGTRLRQGARRMEPDGALLQLYPCAQYPRLRGLRRLHGKAVPRVLSRPLGRFNPHPAVFANILDKYPSSAPDQTLRHHSCRMTNYLPGLDGQITKILSIPILKNILIYRKPKAGLYS